MVPGAILMGNLHIFDHVAEELAMRAAQEGEVDNFDEPSHGRARDYNFLAHTYFLVH
jgi:hypothetical protein